MSNLVKVAIDADDGSRVYRYRAIGPDHFYYSMLYLLIASEKIAIAENTPWWARRDQGVRVRTGLPRLDAEIEAYKRQRH